MKIKFILIILIIIFILQSCGTTKKINTFSSNDEFYLSFRSENLKKLKKLLKKYDINARNNNGRTLLIEAALLKKPIEIVQFLISENANINIQDNDGNTALVFAIENGESETVKILLENGADVNLKPKDKKLFLLACTKVNLDIIKLLVEKGINYKEIDNKGRNALMIALSINTVLAEYLIDIGIDINARDNNGNTALMMCATSDLDMDYLDLLIKKGANINIINNENVTALDIALKYENKETIYNNEYIIDMLKKAGAKRAIEL